MTKRFNLRLWFAIASFGLIALICAVSALFLARLLTHALLERESEVSQEFLQSIVRAEGEGAFVALPAEGDAKALGSFSRHLLSMPGLLRANIYATDQTVIWSTEHSLIGRRFDSNPELRDALGGSRVTEIKSLGDMEKHEHIALGANERGHFIEAYIPIRSLREPHAVIGVVEFYKLPAELNKVIVEGNQIIWLSAAGAALLLFFGLYGIVQRGAKLIEQQQVALFRLEALGAIGQMASAVAHSLRNPMANIRSSAELWTSDAEKPPRDVADEIIAEVDRMDRYVRDLLAYVHAEGFELRPTDPVQLVEQSMARFAPAMKRRSIECAIEDKRDRDVLVMADGSLLEKAIASVVSNASEAMSGGGRLHVSVDRQPSSKTVTMTFADTGHGIPAGLRANVAQQYFTTKDSGLGLGLALAIGIVEKCGGHLAIDGSSGQGTAVRIVLQEA